MIYRITGGIAFLLIGLQNVGVGIPPMVTGIFAIIAGVALLAGV